MIFLHYKIKEFLENLKRSLDVAMRDTFISDALLTEGWDETILNQGLEFHRKAQELFEKQIKEKGEQVDARRKYEKLFAEMNEIYKMHMKFCRVYLSKNKTGLKELTLDVPREKTINGWIMQAKAFYANLLANDELITGLGMFAINRQKLEDAQTKLFGLEQAKEDHDIETGEAQDATRNRDEAVEEAYGWASAYQVVLKLVLRERPEQLEKVRIKHYSDGYKRKKQEEPAAGEQPVEEPTTTDPQQQVNNGTTSTEQYKIG